MKYSVDITEASAVVYLSVVCRRNLVTNGCKSQVVDYDVHLQTPSSQWPLGEKLSLQWIAHNKLPCGTLHISRLSGKRSEI